MRRAGRAGRRRVRAYRYGTYLGKLGELEQSRLSPNGALSTKEGEQAHQMLIGDRCYQVWAEPCAEVLDADTPAIENQIARKVVERGPERNDEIKDEACVYHLHSAQHGHWHNHSR